MLPDAAYAVSLDWGHRVTSIFRDRGLVASQAFLLHHRSAREFVSDQREAKTFSLDWLAEAVCPAGLERFLIWHGACASIRKPRHEEQIGAGRQSTSSYHEGRREAALQNEEQNQFTSNVASRPQPEPWNRVRDHRQ